MGKVAVITGTNSNLGLNIAYRFLEKVDFHEDVTLVVTSRTLPRVRECINMINRYHSQLERSGILQFDYLLVDFTDMVSVLSAYYELNKKYQEINYFFVNAAQGVYDGISWLGACKEILSDPIEGVTNPHYKIQRIGVKTDDGLGTVFQANVFGPYYLIQKLLPQLEKGNAVIVWISSLMSDPKYLDLEDMQLLKTDASYEGSKRLVDLLHLATYENLKARGIRQYLVQPGIFISKSFFKFLNVFTYFGMLFIFYVARWLGSSWHNISGYLAANAPIYVALADESLLKRQDIKYGSASTRNGREYLKNQEIDPTGKDQVLKYFKNMEDEWDLKLKDQIKNTRIAM
ncbi:probable 3-keto-steroid reductase [Saccharomycodes ludwigii]|uniref:3beta-hydroxysteroid 3-dehydrogenase n=2 Tax=Saccharomycodes ludwigii TaxID=36035 RepID=A0A376BC18_9ASCO|nr:probable 3-keto-steroid reductase [Saccharomycodes ludwigii]